MSARLVGVGLALLAGVAIPLEARADGVEPVRFDYDAPATCPSRDTFIAEVLSRTSRARSADAGERARTFRVTLTLTRTGARGALFVTDVTEDTSQRVVDGDSCAAVVSALALVTALAIDPQASTGPIPIVAAAPPPPLQPAPSLPKPPSPPQPQPAPPASPRPSPRAPPPPRPAESKPPPKPTDQAREKARPEPLRLDVALDAAFTVFAPPVGPVFGGALGSSIAIERRAWLSPEFRFGFGYSGTDLSAVPGIGQTSDGTATFTWLRGDVDVCPIRIPLARTLALRPCALGRAGALVSAGHPTGAPAPKSIQPWVELGASALLEWRLVGPLAIEVEGGGSLVPLRHPYVFDNAGEPSTQGVYTPSVVMAEGRVGLAVHFP